LGVAREPAAGSVFLQLDDGSYEQVFGIGTQNGVGSQSVYLNRFTPDPTMLPFTIDAVSILFPVHNAGGLTGLTSGLSFDVLVFADPSGSGDPANTTLVSRKSATLAPSDTVFQNVLLDLPIVVQSGDVWVGFTDTVTRNDNRLRLWAATDTSSLNQDRSRVFFNDQAGEHFDGPLATADVVGRVGGNMLIRAQGQVGGLTCVTWGAPGGSLVDGGLPPPVNAHVCDDVPEPRADEFERPRDTLMGYNVYRSNQPGVQPTPENFFTSVPPTQTSTGSSASEGGSFFVVTAVYDTGESGPSNEVAIVPPTVTKVKVTDTKIAITATGLTQDFVQLFVDGIPFVSQAVIKNGGRKVVQKGTLVTGQTMDAYLAAHNNHARIDVRNSTGAIRSVDFTR
jgi:hypothetical protein